MTLRSTFQIVTVILLILFRGIFVIKIAGLDLSMNSSGLIKFVLGDELEILIERMGFTEVKRTKQTAFIILEKETLIADMELLRGWEN